MNLCRWGLHRPLRHHGQRFVDRVSGRDVYLARCPCGRRWLTDTLNPWLGFTAVSAETEEP